MRDALPPMYMFVPRDPLLQEKSPAMYGVYLRWREEDWFKQKLRDYHYDRVYTPGPQIETRYHEWAAKKGMRIVQVTDAKESCEGGAGDE